MQKHHLGGPIGAFIQHLETGNYNAKVKSGMIHLGLAAGTVRRPMTPLSAAEREDFGRIIDQNVAAFEAATAASSTPVG